MASATDLLVGVGDPGSATTLDSPGYSIGGTSINVVSTSNWPSTGEAVIFAIDESETVNGVEQQVAGTYNEFEGTVASATQITNVDWKRGSGDRNYSAGTTTRVYIPVSAERENRIKEWGEAEHSPADGTHTDITADSLTVGTDTWAQLLSGWADATGTWTYSAWDADTRIATITVPSGATSIYQPGMRVKFDQTTDGTKYGIIHAVASTTLTVFMHADDDFDNETITNPHYSVMKTPFGFDADKSKWTVETASTTDRSTSSATFATLTDALTVGVGAWNVYYKAFAGITGVGSTNTQNCEVTLSTDASTETDEAFTLRITLRESTTATKDSQVTLTCDEEVAHSSETTYTLMGRASGGALEVNGSVVATIIRAVSNYL